MRISKRPARYPRALLAAAATGAGLAGLLGAGGIADASTGPTHPGSLPVADSCTGVSGSASYSPGLRNTKLRTEHALLTGTTSGCSDMFIGPVSGTGTLTATMSGTASAAAENFSGTFTITWPASTGFNPSNGTLTVTEANGLETVEGQVASGFHVGCMLNMQYLITGHTGAGTRLHPITGQSFANSQPLNIWCPDIRPPAHSPGFVHKARA